MIEAVSRPVAVIDAGHGNLTSVVNAISDCGGEAFIISAPTELRKYHSAILPGVGAFSAGMNALSEQGWIPEIFEFTRDNRPLLGICLGMQLLFEKGFEAGVCNGLELLPGEVSIINPDQDMKIPHVGWNSLSFSKEHALLKGLNPSADVYFTHSYVCRQKNKSLCIATCDYGEQFSAIVAHENLVGVQFHPEKSRPLGLKFLTNFLRWRV